VAASPQGPVPPAQPLTPLQAPTVRRARNGDLLVFAFNGFMLATWMSRLPQVKSIMGLSPGQLGIMLLAISIGALTGLPIAGRLLHWMGSVQVVRLGTGLALPGMVLAAVGVTLGWPLPLAMVGLVLVGFGSGIWDVAQNLEGTVIEQALGRSIMPWFHASFSAGTVAGALVAFAMIRLDVPLLPHVIGMAVLGAIVVAWGTQRFMPGVAPHEDSPAQDARRGGQQSAWTEPRTLLIGVMVLAAAFTEGTANDWMAVAFVDGHGVSAAQGVLALTVFLVFMTAGRIAGTSVLDRHGRVPVLRALFGCALVGSLLVVYGSTPLAYLGAAVWGVGASLGFPVGMSAAADDPSRAALRLSVVATIGYGAFLAGPAVVGFIGDHVGVLRALTVVGLVSALALLVVPAARPLSDGDRDPL
jgi:predicted MFS family arabinose efflux permease